jgi:membrane protease YdiL (CAAX protease family)
MSLTPESLPDHIESTPAPAPTHEGLDPAMQPAGLDPAVPASSVPVRPAFPAWKAWDVAAIVLFSIVIIVVFTIIALFVARIFPQYRNASFSDLATDARVVIGAQAAAYPIILLFIFLTVRSRSHESFRQGIRWNWPGATAPGFIASGIILALVVDSLARFLPIPKSLPMDSYFHDATSAYIMAIFGVTLAPLMEEMFFRGLLYPILDKYFGVVAGVLLTAAAFAGIHGAQLGFAWAPVLSIFVVGVVFTLVRVKRDSVASSFLMHCGYNLALFSALWISSDHFRHLEKVTG